MVRDSAIVVAQAVRGARSSFYWPMRLLPRAKREALFSIYAFCRALDDIADGPGAAEHKLALLAAWRDELTRPRLPAALALTEAKRRFALPDDELHALIDGMEMDVRGELVAPAMDHLRLYCRRVAGAVGVLIVHVFGVPEAKLFAERLGEALQLTNILRDVDEDATLGRLYLPRELLEAHAVPPTLAALDHAGLEAVCRQLAGLAEQAYAEAMDALPNGKARRLWPALAMGAGYHHLLDCLQKRGWRDRHQRPRLRRLHLLWIALCKSLNPG